VSTRRAGVPINALHENIDDAATFEVRVTGLVPMVNKSGPAVTHDETITH
jgi:hypothetical protein